MRFTIRQLINADTIAKAKASLWIGQIAMVILCAVLAILNGLQLQPIAHLTIISMQSLVCHRLHHV